MLQVIEIKLKLKKLRKMSTAISKNPKWCPQRVLFIKRVEQRTESDLPAGPSQFGLGHVCVQGLGLYSVQGAEKGVVLIQVGGDELWEISL